MNPSEAISLFAVSPPFEELDRTTLEELALTLTEESYRRGTTLEHRDDEQGKAVRIIKKGAVKVTIPFGRNDEALIDYRGEGEIFGYLALLTGDQLRGEIVFLEDTLCYRIERRTVLRLLQRHPLFARQFFVTFLHKYVAKPYRELGKKKLFYGGGDRLLFTTPLGEVITRPLVVAGEDISIRQAAEIMAEQHISSLVLENAAGLPAGIVTNSDLRDKVIAKGRDPEQPVKRIQSLSLAKAEDGELCIEALFKMSHYHVHHLLVLDNGRPKGMVTTHDLMRLRGKSPVAIVREIEERHSTAELAASVKRIHDLLGHFLQEGVKATHILRIASEICDRLLGKALEMAQKASGPTPLAWCFLVYGGCGRQEQVLPDLLQGAVLFANPGDAVEEEAAREYFQGLIAHARRILGEIATAPEAVREKETVIDGCASLVSWERAFTAMLTADQETFARQLDLFDYRCLYGDRRLAEELDKMVRGRLEDNPEFFRAMAKAVLVSEPPLPESLGDGPAASAADNDGWLRHGVRPLVDLARLLALENRIWESNTPERLRLLQEMATPIENRGRELSLAFDLICGYCLHQQYKELRQGRTLAAMTVAAEKNDLESRILQEAYVEVGMMQQRLRQRYAV